VFDTSGDPMAKPRTPREREYRLLVTSRYHEREQRHKTRILLETTKAFASFQYELSVQATREDRSLRYRILGLSAPTLSLPASGPARFEREYDDLQGPVDIVIEGLDGSTNTFSFDVAPGAVRIVHQPKEGFVELIPDEQVRTSSPSRPRR
jgi:hypothetical protein